MQLHYSKENRAHFLFKENNVPCACPFAPAVVSVSKISGKPEQKSQLCWSRCPLMEVENIGGKPMKQVHLHCGDGQRKFTATVHELEQKKSSLKVCKQ